HAAPMKHLKNGRFVRYFAAMSCILVAAALAGSHPAWSRHTRLAIFLLALAGAIVLASVLVRLRVDEAGKSRRTANEKLSNNLVALSSAAIVAVYVAGYQRTNSAAEKLATHTERRKSAPQPTGKIIASVATPTPVKRTVPSIPKAATPAPKAHT